MKITISLFTILIFLGSCANYNSIQYGSKSNLKVSSNVSILDLQEDELISIKISTSVLSGKCDTIQFKDGTVNLYRVGNKGVNYMDVIGCQSNLKETFRISDIQSIKFSNGIIWPPLNKSCDTLYLTNGKTRVLKSTFMSNIAILGVDYTSEKKKTISTPIDIVQKIHFSDNHIWVNMNRSQCDTITFLDGSKSYYRVGNKGSKLTDLYNCKTKSKTSVRNNEIKEIKFANGEVWPSNADIDTVYTSNKGVLLLRDVKRNKSFLTGEESENGNKSVSVRLVYIESVHYANGTSWINKDVNNKSMYSFYRVRKTLITIGAIIGGLALALFIALLSSDVS